MARKLQFKRGNQAQMPVLDVGEPAFATDAGKLYLGGSTGNIAIARDDHTHTAASVGLAYALCATAAGTVEKTVTVPGFSLSPGAMAFVRFSYGVPAGGTLNVSNTGAKPIYWREKVIGSDGILAGDGCAFVYTGRAWDLIAIDRLAGAGGAQSVSFSADSWATIQKFCAAGAHRNVYARGDTKTITLSTGERITVRIEDFDHDDLESGGKAPLSLLMVNGLDQAAGMNSASNTNVGGWDSSEMRAWMSGTLFGQLPSDLQGVIKSVNKRTSAGNGSPVIVTTADKLWLLSHTEVNFSRNANYSPGGEGTGYPLLVDSASRIKRNGGTANNWWLRSPYATGIGGFVSVTSTGGRTSLNSRYACAIVAGFCI